MHGGLFCWVSSSFIPATGFIGTHLRPRDWELPRHIGIACLAMLVCNGVESLETCLLIRMYILKHYYFLHKIKRYNVAHWLAAQLIKACMEHLHSSDRRMLHNHVLATKKTPSNASGMEGTSPCSNPKMLS